MDGMERASSREVTNSRGSRERLVEPTVRRRTVVMNIAETIPDVEFMLEDSDVRSSVSRPSIRPSTRSEARSSARTSARVADGATPSVRRATCIRKTVRDAFNLQELYMLDLFEEFDDGSGCLTVDQLKLLLEQLNPSFSSNKVAEWVMKLADKSSKETISRNELWIALQAYHGYVSLPQDLSDLFAEFASDDPDCDGNCALNLAELQALLSKLNGGPISEMEAQEVMDVADVLENGTLGRFQLLGAVGAWYVNVGRKPTPAMAMAFIMNNRTSGRMSRIVDYLIISTLPPTAVFPLWGVLGAGDGCTALLKHLLLADGTLWLVLALVMLMKGHWVQLVNRCCPIGGWQVVYRMSWLFVLLELSCLSLLATVEGLGYKAVQQAEAKDDHACDEGAHMPIDFIRSFKQGQWRHYAGFLDFAAVWFMFNFWFNFVTLVPYYAYAVVRFHKVWKADRSMHNEWQLVGYCSDCELCGDLATPRTVTRAICPEGPDPDRETSFAMQASASVEEGGSVEADGAIVGPPTMAERNKGVGTS